MKNIIFTLVVSASVGSFAFVTQDPSTITEWKDKVALYQGGLHQVSAGKVDTPHRAPREPSVEEINLFMEGEILRYNAEKTAEMIAMFPGLKSSDYATWKTMTDEQKRSFRRRYRSAWLEAFVGTAIAEYSAWKKMTETERAAWESNWKASHPGCTPFVVPPLIETEQNSDTPMAPAE